MQGHSRGACRTVQAGGHVLLCCGRRYEAVAVALEAGGDEAQRVVAAAQAQLRLLCPGQVRACSSSAAAAAAAAAAAISASALAVVCECQS